MNREPMMQVSIECGTFEYALEAEDVLLFSPWRRLTAYGLLWASPEASDMGATGSVPGFGIIRCVYTPMSSLAPTSPVERL